MNNECECEDINIITYSIYILSTWQFYHWDILKQSAHNIISYSFYNLTMYHNQHSTYCYYIIENTWFKQNILVFFHISHEPHYYWNVLTNNNVFKKKLFSKLITRGLVFTTTWWWNEFYYKSEKIK